jgi:hypothetical protein
MVVEFGQFTQNKCRNLMQNDDLENTMYVNHDYSQGYQTRQGKLSTRLN